MSYDQFWFVETRNQANNLKRWFLYGLIIFVFVTVFTTLAIKSMYYNIDNYEIQAEYPTVKVTEAKKTNVNGYVKGTVTNQSDVELNGKYIKFTFYTKNGTEAGKEYIEIGTLKSQETKTYELNFKYNKIEKFIITISNSKD